MEGQVLKGVGSFYTVRLTDGQTCVCKLRGRFRLEREIIIAGDYVKVEQTGESKTGIITDVLPRKNSLLRPAVANIDRLMVVITASAPKPDFSLVDSLMILCEIHGIKPALIINKYDAYEKSLLDTIHEDYDPTGYAIYHTSAYTGEGIPGLRRVIADGSASCFTGQSGVGKSSVLNALVPDLNQETGEMSLRARRGKHTTRVTELWPIAGGSAIIDTPGFSLLDVGAIEPSELAGFYPEMRGAAGQCKFAGCLHNTEPDCAVRELLTSGKLSQGRYERYKRMLAALIEKDKNKYA